MTTQHHHAPHHHRPRQFWLKQESVLAALAACLAFALIYAYTGDADLYYPFVGALGMGTIIYTVVWMSLHRKL